MPHRFCCAKSIRGLPPSCNLFHRFFFTGMTGRETSSGAKELFARHSKKIGRTRPVLRQAGRSPRKPQTFLTFEPAGSPLPNTDLIPIRRITSPADAAFPPPIRTIYCTSTTVVLTEKAIAFCNDKTETWLDVAFANKTKPKYESTEQLVAKGLFPGAVALPEPSRASQSPAAFECSQVLEGSPPLF